MIELEQVERRVITKNKMIVKERKCQSCLKKCPNPSENDWGEGWGEDKPFLYTVSGDSYPEGDCRKLNVITLCPGCYQSLIVDMLKEKGIVAQEYFMEDESFVLGSLY